jgi:mono/diheme cytochrome c family protein
VPVSFGTDVVPVLQAKCAACHTAGGAGAGKVLMFSGSTEPQYETIKASIGLMIQKIEALEMPPGASEGTVSAASLQLLKTWRDEGTQHN